MTETAATSAEPTVRRPKWLLLLAMAALAIGLANVGVFLYGLTLPGRWRVEESITIDAPPEKVHSLLAEPRRWTTWSTWNADRDPTLEFTFQGPERGKDAKMTWAGRQLGFGSLEITESEPGSHVRYRLSVQGTEFSTDGAIRLEREGGGTLVRWTDGGTLAGTTERLFRERLEAAVAADFAASLRGLKEHAERPDP